MLAPWPGRPISTAPHGDGAPGPAETGDAPSGDRLPRSSAHTRPARHTETLAGRAGASTTDRLPGFVLRHPAFDALVDASSARWAYASLVSRGRCGSLHQRVTTNRSARLAGGAHPQGSSSSTRRAAPAARVAGPDDERYPLLARGVRPGRRGIDRRVTGGTAHPWPGAVLASSGCRCWPRWFCWA